MKLNKKFITISLGIIIVLWLGSGFFIYHYYPIKQVGIVGDMFGAINSLFSGLALFGIILALIMQSKDLKKQQEAIELQHQELVETREEFKITRVTNLIYKQMEFFNKNLVRNSLIYEDTSLIETVSDFIVKYKEHDILGAHDKALQLMRMNKSRINRLLNDSFDAIANVEHLIDTNYFEDNKKVKTHLRNVIYNSFDLSIKELIKIKYRELRNLYPDVDQEIINNEEREFKSISREINKYSNNPM